MLMFISACMVGAADTCCEMGYEFAEIVFEEQEYPGSIIPRELCYPKALAFAKQKHLSMKCILAFYKSCVAEIEYWKEGLEILLTIHTFHFVYLTWFVVKFHVFMHDYLV